MVGSLWELKAGDPGLFLVIGRQNSFYWDLLRLTEGTTPKDYSRCGTVTVGSLDPSRGWQRLV